MDSRNRKRILAQSNAPSPAKTVLWLGVFIVWSFLLSGAMTSFTHTPGIVQAKRLEVIHQERVKELQSLEATAIRLKADIDLLENNRQAQETEIRRVLGFAAIDEIVFDFSPRSESPEKSAQAQN